MKREIRAKHLHAGLAAVLGFAGNDETRPKVFGVCFEVDEDNVLRVIGTDGHTLCRYVVDRDAEDLSGLKAIVDVDQVKALLSALDADWQRHEDRIGRLGDHDDVPARDYPAATIDRESVECMGVSLKLQSGSAFAITAPVVESGMTRRGCAAAHLNLQYVHLAFASMFRACEITEVEPYVIVEPGENGTNATVFTCPGLKRIDALVMPVRGGSDLQSKLEGSSRSLMMSGYKP